MIYKKKIYLDYKKINYNNRTIKSIWKSTGMYRGRGEKEKKRKKGRRGREKGGRERESKGWQMRGISIPHFLRKKNYALFL